MHAGTWTIACINWRLEPTAFRPPTFNYPCPPPSRLWPQVLNIRPNLKVAVEVQTAADLPLYALNQRMADMWVGSGGARDYTATNVLVLDVLKKCSARMGP